MRKEPRDGWEAYYRHARLAYFPELFVVRFFRALRNRGAFLAEHGVDDWPLPANARILDFGCGNGRHLTFLVDDGWDVTGCDLSPQAVALAQQMAPTRQVDVVGDSLPYPAHSFDVVLAHGVFDHIPAADRAWWIREAARVLQKGGLLYASFIMGSLHGTGRSGEEVLATGDEAGLTQTFYTPEAVLKEYGRVFRIRSIAYDHRGLVYPTEAVVEHRLWAFLERGDRD